MKFGKINRIILLGGSRCTAELALYLSQIQEFDFDVYTAPRQVNDILYNNGLTFDGYFKLNNLKYQVVEDINSDHSFLSSITETTLAIGLGEAWSFNKFVIERFNGRLLDLMGIRLPQYRGGAHYSWQILRGSKIGACNLQEINEEMIQGVYDSGKIIKFKEYHFPSSVRIPNDYFDFAVLEEINFIKEFLQEINLGKDFKGFSLQENFSLYFPRLNTLKNAFVDWQWDTLDIESMICAFDTPYAGVSTILNNILVRIKNAKSETNDGSFHPFQCGLIYKIYDNFIYVATRNGSIIIKEVNDEFGNSIFASLRIGDRFFTPNGLIEKALTTKIEY